MQDQWLAFMAMHELWIIPCHIGAFIYMKCLEWYGRQFFTYCSELFYIIVVLYLDRDSILSTQYKHLTRLLTWQYYEPQLWHLNNNGKDIFSNAKRWSNLFNSMYIINDEFSWTKTQQIFNPSTICNFCYKCVWCLTNPFKIKLKHEQSQQINQWGKNLGGWTQCCMLFVFKRNFWSRFNFYFIFNGIFKN